MARVLWIIGFGLTFLFFGVMGIALVVITVRHGFTLRRLAAGIELVSFVAFLWWGFRVIVLNRADR